MRRHRFFSFFSFSFSFLTAFFIFFSASALCAAMPAARAAAFSNSPSAPPAPRENEPLAYVLMERAANDPAHSGAFLQQALLAAPNFPPVYFSLAAREFRNFPGGLLSGIYYCIEGFKAYGRNWWWAMDLSGLLAFALVWSFFIALAAAAALRFSREFPLLKHDINEDRRHFFLFLLPAAGAFFGPFFFLASVFLLLGLYFQKRDRVLVYLIMLFFVFVPYLSGWAESVYHMATPDMRAVVAVNEGTDSSLALDTLQGERDFDSLFSYGLAAGRAGKFPDAIAAYSAAIDKKKDARAYVNLGNCYYLLGEPDKAGQFYQASIGIRPGAAAYFNLARISRDQLDYKKGDELYKEAEDLDPSKVSRFMGEEEGNSSAVRLMYDSLGMHDFYGLFRKVQRGSRASSLGLCPSLLAPAAILFAVFFFFYGKKGRVKAFRCSRCGNILCERCEKDLYWGRMCSDCYRSLVKIEVLDPKKRVARLLKIHGSQLKRSALIRALGFAPPGIAYIYGGNILQGMLMLWGFLFFLLAALLNPLFTVGLSTMGHAWLDYIAAIGIGLLYVLSFAGIRRRQGREWL